MGIMKTQEQRLEEIIKTNNKNYKLKDVALVFTMCMEGYEKQSKTVASIKSKITKEEWNSLINGITASFLMSLHAYKMPLDEALKLANTEGIMGVGVAHIGKEKKR